MTAEYFLEWRILSPVMLGPAFDQMSPRIHIFAAELNLFDR